ncbi:MAG: hypothetical protein KDA96_26320, partial [Planctomycetaceae bacterium]|nr:hypothetical protein [Planctomycetaceae bacterium]
SLDFAGGATLNTVSMYASSGGQLLFGPGSSFATNPNVHLTLEASGEGSLIDLSALTTFAGTTGTQGYTVFYTNINAYAGGKIDLSGVSSVQNQTYIRATGQDSHGIASTVDLSSMATLQGTGRGSVLYASDTGVITTPAVTSIQVAALVAANGATLDLSSAVTYDGGLGASNTLRAIGEGSLLDLSGITTFAGVLGTQGYTVFYTTIDAQGGGRVDLSSAATVSNQTYLLASGQDGSNHPSTIDLSSLTALNGAGRGSVLSVSDVGLISTPVLNSITMAGLLAQNGAVLDLSSASTYLGGNGAANSLRADGQGSVVDLSGLTSFVGATGSQGYTIFYSTVEALNGGRMDLRNVTSSTGQVNYSSSGHDSNGTPSLVDLSSLVQVTGNSLNGISVTDVGLIDLSALTTLYGTSLSASAGGHLDVSSVTEYHGLTVSNSSIRATGAGSEVDLSGLQILEGNAGNQGWSVWYLTITADDSGLVSLGAGTNQVSRRVSLISDTGIIEAGELHVLPGTTFAASGTLHGDLINESAMRIGTANGDAPGQLNITGSFTQTASGTLLIQLAGLTAGTGFDQLNASSSLTLNGALSVSLTGGFSPADGDDFEVLTFTSRTGDFSVRSG